MPVAPSELQLAWVAGLFEGEGTVRITMPAGRNLGQLSVRLPNTDRAYIALLNQWWPGHVREETRGENATIWCWQRSSRKAADFLSDIVPYIVSKRLLDKALLGLEFQEGKRNGTKGDAVYAERQRALQEQMVRIGDRRRSVEELPVIDRLELLARRRLWHEERRVEIAEATRRAVAEAQGTLPMAVIARALEIDRSTLYRVYAEAA